MAEHFAHVSVRELMQGPNTAQEIKYDLESALNYRVGTVKITPGGILMPAAVTLRTTVTKQFPVGQRIRDDWHVTIAPNDRLLRQRFFAEAQATRLGAVDVPVAGIAAASYDVVKALGVAHTELSKLKPQHRGTFVEMSFAITRDMTRVVTYKASSVEVLRRNSARIKHHNKIAHDRWMAAHWPAQGPIRVLGLRVWPPWSIDPEDRIPEPVIPQSDRWEPDGELYTAIGDVVAEQFVEILESLWKAAFKQDPFVADQLTKLGYRLDKIEATRMGVGSLRELMGRFNNSGHMTMMAVPDLIEDLGDDAIRNLTHQ